MSCTYSQALGKCCDPRTDRCHLRFGEITRTVCEPFYQSRERYHGSTIC